VTTAIRKLVWEKSGVQNRKPIYWAEGVDSLDGGKTTYQIYSESGLWMAGGENVRRVGGITAHSVGEARKKVQAIDDAARKAVGRYNLSADVVMAPGTRSG
jgi:hypothetical protein